MDLGGTKLWVGMFSENGTCLSKIHYPVKQYSGDDLSDFICFKLKDAMTSQSEKLRAVGIAIPGMYNAVQDEVWAPNIEGWKAFPLKARLQEVVGNIPISIEDDRTCCILGEAWQGAAKTLQNVVFITVGTGIGAGILSEGKVLKGSLGTAGAVGWMALEGEEKQLYATYGCFEAFSSGDGIARLARQLMEESPAYNGTLKKKTNINATQIFRALEQHDPIANKVITFCIKSWGKAVANLVSILNPELIVFGGGIFGPALKYLPDINTEMCKWAQPLASSKVRLMGSSLNGLACLYGAAWSATRLLNDQRNAIYA